MDFINTEEEVQSLDIGGQFFADLTPATATDLSLEIAPHAGRAKEQEENGAVEEIRGIGANGEHKEAEDFFIDDYKIVGELRPQDCFILQKLRNGVIVPTWEMSGTPGRQMGKVLKIAGDTSAEYTENLERAGDYSFPEGSINRALEVIY